MINWKTIFGGVIIAVIAALLADWFERRFSGATYNPAEVSADRVRALPLLLNLNQTPESAATAYAGGAPVTNFRATTRVGVFEAPTA